MEEEKEEAGYSRRVSSMRSSARGSGIAGGSERESMRSSHIDQGDLRCQAVFLRRDDEIDAMGSFDRFKTKLKSFGRRVCCRGNPSSPEKKDDDVDGDGQQYRLEAAQTTPRNRWTWTQGTTVTTAGSLGITPNQALAMSLHWMFRVNFFFLFSLSCLVFFGLVMIFSCLILIAGALDSKCVRIGGDEIGENGARFADAFALSWTTFSTVGYGSTYPALSHENDNPSNCMLITVICSLESFIGVLYSGFCGAILFGKVLRIQSHASVMFSDPIVIRYGSGVADPNYASDDEDAELGFVGGDDLDVADRQEPLKTHSTIPCPVLEFRIVNRLYNETGGEIMDATLNVVANVDANDADFQSERAVDAYSQRDDNSIHHLNSMGTEFSHRSGDGASVRSAFSNHTVRSLLSNQSIRSIRNGTLGTLLGQHISVDEDHTGQIISKRIFSKMRIEAQEHPFFKRVWLAKHVLDDTSPILTPRARRLVKRNKGHWPETLNTAAGVRRSIKFNQVLVSLNGVSNVSAADVYAQKIYDFVDVNIGYQFVNLLFRDEKGTLRVDTELINDVREQNGGGGEALTVPDDEND